MSARRQLLLQLGGAARLRAPHLAGAESRRANRCELDGALRPKACAGAQGQFPDRHFGRRRAARNGYKETFPM
jgi:hypothetical protein